MAIPPGRYQNGVDMRHTCQVDLDSPQNEPVLKWTVKPEVTNSFTDVMVDGEGGVWYNDGFPGNMSSTIIVRLNPDGSEDFRKKLMPNGGFSASTTGLGGSSISNLLSMVRPVVVLNNGVILYVTTMSSPLSLESNFLLECMDIDGQVRWKTDPIEISNLATRTAWRAPEDRMVMPVSESSVNFYSIESGEFLGSIDVAGFPIILDYGGPIPLDDGDFIFYGSKRDASEESIPFISRIRQDGTSAWYQEYPTFQYSQPVVINENGILCCGNSEGVTGIDSNDGSILWGKFSASNYALGLNRDGKFIVSGFDTEDGDGHFRLMNEDGSMIWSDNVFTRGPDDMVVYRDNSILVAYSYGISLVEPDGSVRWTIDADDLQYTGTDRFSQWRLNPTPDGNIVAICDNMEGSYHSEIYYLEQQ
ncbi:MAG: hypothetical protein NTY09_04270 [bacterium]|nr:hypothetical protein [bacterium]